CSMREPQAEREGATVELALDRESLAALIETEDRVVEVEDVDQDLDAVGEQITRLRVDLRVGVEIYVAGGALQAARRARGEVVLPDVGVVVRDRDSAREGTAIVRESEVEFVRRRPQQLGVIVAARHRGA